jgi:cytochrome c-type biogenesis protein CcmH
VAAWVACGIVLVVALAYGSGHRTGAETTAQRAAAVDAAVRCPSCEGLSVADSTAATAVAIRASVLGRLRAGQSEAQIEQFLVSRYGPSILLRPPTSGVAALVWAIPIVAIALGVAGLAAAFWRRRVPERVVVDDADRDIVDAALAGPR